MFIFHFYGEASVTISEKFAMPAAFLWQCSYLEVQAVF
jgi:hypothetical protein